MDTLLRYLGYCLDFLRDMFRPRHVAAALIVGVIVGVTVYVVEKYNENHGGTDDTSE